MPFGSRATDDPGENDRLQKSHHSEKDRGSIFISAYLPERYVDSSLERGKAFEPVR